MQTNKSMTDALATRLDHSQRGYQLLLRARWIPWSGLGKYEQGCLEPINPLSMSPYWRNVLNYDVNSILKTSAVCLPEIELQIENLTVLALIDSGSEITCISEELYFKLQKIQQSIPVLPLKAIQIQGAFSKKSRKVTRQILLSVKIQETTFHFCCLIIPELLKNFIIGTDWLNQQQATLGFAT